MPGNTFGTMFRVTTWGESHGPALGAVIDGCPPMLALSEKDIQTMLDRRKPGNGSAAGTARREGDSVRILSGVFQGLTTGTPICVMVENTDHKSRDYGALERVFRPGHGDYTYYKKYGIRDHRGGGRASARETVGRVAAGAVAGRVLERAGIKVFSATLEMGGVKAVNMDYAQCGENPYCCPDADAALKMDERVKEVRGLGDSIGGIVEVTATGLSAGLGEPVFDKLDAKIAAALMSIGAVKGVEIGSGFAAARSTGSINNDPVTIQGFSSNNAGGVLAGVSSGQDIVARVAVKPIPSIVMEQDTVDLENSAVKLSVGGRHDVCAIPRVNVVCEAMIMLVLADFILQQRAVSGW